MERTSTKHGARTDDALQRETASLTRGAPVESRVEESRMAEPAGDGEFVPSAVLHALGEPIMGMPADEVAVRSELAMALRPGAFPADAPTLLRVAAQDGAPEWVCETLRRVDPVQRYENVQQLWEAAGGHHELRTLPHEREAPAPPPVAPARARKARGGAPGATTAPVGAGAVEPPRAAVRQPAQQSYVAVVAEFVRAGWKLTTRTANIAAAPLRVARRVVAPRHAPMR